MKLFLTQSTIYGWKEKNQGNKSSNRSRFPVIGSRLKKREMKSISKTLESLDLIHHFGQLNRFLVTPNPALITIRVESKEKGQQQ